MAAGLKGGAGGRCNSLNVRRGILRSRCETLSRSTDQRLPSLDGDPPDRHVVWSSSLWTSAIATAALLCVRAWMWCFCTNAKVAQFNLLLDRLASCLKAVTSYGNTVCLFSGMAVELHVFQLCDCMVIWVSEAALIYILSSQRIKDVISKVLLWICRELSPNWSSVRLLKSFLASFSSLFCFLRPMNAAHFGPLGDSACGKRLTYCRLWVGMVADSDGNMTQMKANVCCVGNMGTYTVSPYQLHKVMTCQCCDVAALSPSG